MADQRVWFYRRGGPCSPEEIKDMVTSGHLKPNDLVWKKGMAAWAPPQEIPEIFADEEPGNENVVTSDLTGTRIPKSATNELAENQSVAVASIDSSGRRRYRMSIRDTLFSFDGRLPRTDFFLSCLCVLLAHLLFFALGFSMADRKIPDIVGICLLTFLICDFLFVNWAMPAMVWKRWQDIGWSGWLTWAMLFPLFFPVAVVILLFWPGEKGPNKYGDDPFVGAPA